MKPTEDKEALLTSEEIQIEVEQVFKEDALLRHYVESRGHWEDIAPTIAKAQLAKLGRLGYHKGE